MSKISKKISLILIIISLMFFLSGCMQGTETISVEYLSTFKANNMFDNYTPTIAVNPIWDEREITSKVGDGYNAYGGKIETWVTERKPTDIIEQALIEQLENSGFKVEKISGWNLDSNSIPTYVNSDFILGGKLKTFWVESRPGFATVSVNSEVRFDLIIADVESKEVIWAGQFSGSDKSEKIIRTNESMRKSLSRALTESVNKVFQDNDVKKAIINIVEVKF